ncbi:DUF433 domain-containing protein (plasmid) [Skermanella mucosa]|uniref:DUF433 domain-containing protein n=1 Tax=Skermanella mucosa TaxID=1789672 RepID=UPI00192B26FD|nr:DUF433 domain-containing protein [Skermanella mucosa]UEM24364.1 DUF433 domain-containing protein [Skermanella mucosa]
MPPVTQRNVSFGDLKRHLLSVAEAAQVANMDADSIRKAFQRGILEPGYIMDGNRRLRAINGLDLVYLRIAPSYSRVVRNKLRTALHKALADQIVYSSVHIIIEDLSGRKKSVDVPLERAVDETLAGIEDLKQTSQGIEVGENGEALIRGTNVEVHRIAALVEGGISIEEINHDYPNLSEDQIKIAVEYARVHPKHGRPYPVRTVKSIFRQGTGTMREVLSEEDHTEDDQARRG